MKRIQKSEPKAAGWRIPLFLCVPAVLVVGLYGEVFYMQFRRRKPHEETQATPHYFAALALARPLPQMLDPAQFSNRYVVAAYVQRRRFPRSWPSSLVLATATAPWATAICWPVLPAGTVPTAKFA